MNERDESKSQAETGKEAVDGSELDTVPTEGQEGLWMDNEGHMWHTMDVTSLSPVRHIGKIIRGLAVDDIILDAISVKKEAADGIEYVSDGAAANSTPPPLSNYVQTLSGAWQEIEFDAAIEGRLYELTFDDDDSVIGITRWWHKGHLRADMVTKKAP